MRKAVVKAAVVIGVTVAMCAGIGAGTYPGAEQPAKEGTLWSTIVEPLHWQPPY